jgi:hypothetical protein
VPLLAWDWSGLFLFKMMVVGVGTTNALAVRTLVPDAIAPMKSAREKLLVWVQLASSISLAAWLTALTLDLWLATLLT